MAEGAIHATPSALDSIKEDELRRLHSYWRRKRGPEGWIRARDFRPEHLSSALPYVAVIERNGGEGCGLFIRYAGHAIANPKLGYMRDRPICELRPEWYRDHLLLRYDQAIGGGTPVHQLVVLRYDGVDYDYARLMLPMTRDGAACDHIIVGAVPSPALALFLRRAPQFT